MATITIQANSPEEAMDILKKVYEADPIAQYVKEKKYVHSSLLLAENLGNNQIKITSDYYKECSLRELFDNNRDLE